MATSLPFLLRATTEQPQEPSKTHIESDSTKPDKPTSTRGRKPTKAPPRKKQPQRGMGVEKLERLRLEERWKKITGTNQIDSFNLQPETQLPVSDPIPSIPVQFGTVSYGVPVIHGGGFLGFDQGNSFVVKRIDNGGFAELNRSNNSGQFLLNPHLFGAPDMKVRIGNTGTVFETSKELSSMPKMVQHLDHTPADLFFKKKRVNGENLGYNNARRERITEKSPINGPDFLELNLENKIDLNHDNQVGGFTVRAARSALYANHHNLSKGVEVVAIHRKGNPPMAGNLLVEYEFFPGKRNGKTSTYLKKMELPAAEGSCVTTSDDQSGYYTASNATTNSVDLSLKLSF